MNGITAWFAVVALTAASSAANAFRVTPYVQHPATNAMTLMWLMQENGPGAVAWQEIGGAGTGSGTTTPRLADELSYLPSQINYPNHFLPFTTPYQHRYRLTGLKPDTRYGYTVTCGGCVYSNSFRTAPAADRPIRFVCFSDSETQPESTGAKVVWEDPNDDASKRPYFIDQTTGYASNTAVIVSRQPELLLFAGDLAEMGSKQVDWDEFWRHNAGPINDPAGSIPFLASPGNHEYHDYGSEAGEVGMRKYLSYFEFATNGTSVAADQQERFHRLDYGRATFLFLDLNNGPDGDAAKDTNRYLNEATCRAPLFDETSAQRQWLEAQLADAQRRDQFIFVVSHQCPYSVGYHGRFNGEDGEVLSGTAARALTPLLLRYGATAWLAGHDELYEHSVLHGDEILPGGATNAASLHVYDLGMAGDGLRGQVRIAGTYSNEVFRAHKDAPEVWENGLLVAGGKHYGHLEVNITTNAAGDWEARLTPVYVFVTTNAQGVAQGFDRRTYDDEVVITNTAAPPQEDPFGIAQSIGANGSAVPGDVLIIVPDGATTSVTYTADAFYRIATLTTNNTPIGGANGATEATVTFNATNDVDVTFAVAAAYTTAPIDWFTDNGWGEGNVVPGLDYGNLKMLNVAATNAAAGGTITIEEIEVVGDDVKVAVFIDRTMSLGAEITGTLKLLGATTLEGGFAEIGAQEITIGADQDGTPNNIKKVITYPMAGGKKFYKAVIAPKS
jgi:hypothetical protein